MTPFSSACRSDSSSATIRAAYILTGWVLLPPPPFVQPSEARARSRDRRQIPVHRGDVRGAVDTGSRPLMVAAQNGEGAGALRVLLAAGAAIEARDEDGWTALMVAASYGENPETVQALLDAGADASAQSESSETAWDLVQENDALRGTKAYWALNQLRFD